MSTTNAIKQTAADDIYGKLRAVQEQRDLRNSELIAATLQAVTRMVVQFANEDEPRL